jgi:purine/pyrimidine-nucleoside phosphorylase
MLNVNEYFNGNVKSIGFQSSEGKATVGVMEKGEYEFGTETVEIMKVISGKLMVKLPGESQFKEYKDGDSFIVSAKSKFQLKVQTETAYMCLYK